MKDLLARLRGKRAVQGSREERGLTLEVLPAFKQDVDSSQAIIRINQYNRDRLGVHPGSRLRVRKADRTVEVRVEVASVQDPDTACRLSPRARELLGVDIGDQIEVIPMHHPLGPMGLPLEVREGFREDERATEPLIRLTQADRERLGIEPGSYVQIRHGDHKIPVRVEVSAASDAGKEICRLNPVARTLLGVEVGESVEVIPPETLILLVDISGSMNESLSWGRSKLKATQKAIARLLQSKTRQEEGDLVGVVAFETYVHLIAKPTVRYKEVLRRVEDLYADGRTAMYEGIEYALRLLSDAPGLRRILLLTDGVPTSTSPEKVLELAHQARNHFVVIDTIGVGSSGKKIRYDEGLLRSIAKETGGRFLHVDDVRTLEESFLLLSEEKKIPLLSR